jgi:hypothetical protein
LEVPAASILRVEEWSEDGGSDHDRDCDTGFCEVIENISSFFCLKGMLRYTHMAILLAEEYVKIYSWNLLIVFQEY